MRCLMCASIETRRRHRKFKCLCRGCVPYNSKCCKKSFADRNPLLESLHARPNFRSETAKPVKVPVHLYIYIYIHIYIYIYKYIGRYPKNTLCSVDLIETRGCRAHTVDGQAITRVCRSHEQPSSLLIDRCKSVNLNLGLTLSGIQGTLRRYRAGSRASIVLQGSVSFSSGTQKAT